ncbi:MAG: class II aldolase/adducin family protein [Spirochaetales bacterium]|nr:class II aldolase/adducin family protein [Spirochaetales bacterium]
MYRKNNETKKQIAVISKRLYGRGLTTSLGGNISVRLSGGMLCITPSAKDKADLKPQDMCVLTMGGLNKTQKNKPSIETAIHMAIYKTRPEIHAIVHAHPVFASAFTALRIPVNTLLTAEARVILGEPAKTRYALSGTQQLEKEAAAAAKKSNVFLLENHGVVCLGTTLLEAFHRVEVLEEAARMTFITGLMGKPKQLSKKQVKELLALFGQ